jgi:hypothetical protein
MVENLVKVQTSTNQTTPLVHPKFHSRGTTPEAEGYLGGDL